MGERGCGIARIDAVIFDLDGVLVDSEIWWDEARRAFASSHGRPWDEADRAAVMGGNSRQWAHTMRERLEVEVPEHEVERAVVEAVVARYAAEGPPCIDGAVEAARAIAGHHPVAVASSAHPDVIRTALAATGLADVFSIVVSSDEVVHGKPEPDVYLCAAERLGVDPERCLVVEDSYNGVLAAKAAGMAVVLVPNRSIPPAEGAAALADAVVARLDDLDPRTLIPRAPEPPARVSAAPDPRSRAPRRADHLPGPRIGPRRRTVRYWFSRLLVGLVVRAYLRFELCDGERLPPGPAVYCFNHMNWADPFMLMAVLPFRPRLYFFGPKEEDMASGPRNRVMAWSGAAVPYKPGKNDLLEATRSVRAVFCSGGVLAIAGEGRIHARESELLPLNEGAAYFALRSRVPVVPIAIHGTSWLRFGRRVRIRVGDPIPAEGRPTREAIATLTERTWQALHDLVASQPDFPPPGPFGRWLTDVFNDWQGARPDGARPDGSRREPS